MKNKVLVCMILFVSVLILTHSTECSASQSGLFTYEIKGNGTVKITGFDWSSNAGNDVYVPRMIEGYTVTEIGPYAFSSEEETHDFDQSIGQSVIVVLPDTISTIGEKAFFCTQITAITVPKSVQMIGSGAFAGCKNLNSHNVEVGNEVYTTIDGVLYDKQNKELVSVPAGRAGNEKSPFSWQQKTIPDGIISIGDYAFAGFYISGTLTFPNSVKEIGSYTFYHVKDKVNVSGQTLDFNNITNIGSYSFCGFETINNIYLQGDKVSNIGPYAFCSAEIDLDASYPNNETIQPFKNIKTIGEYAFAYATIFPNTLDNYYTLTFPTTLTEIGEGAFREMSFFHTAKFFRLDFLDTKITSIPRDAFRQTDMRVVLPNGTTHIGEYAFYGYEGIGINIPASVIAIDSFAFAYSKGGWLDSEEKSHLSEIGDYAFYDAGIIIETLPEGLESIGEKALWSGPATISIPASVKSIGDEFCDRSNTTLEVVPGSYAAIYAAENGYRIEGNEDTSWLGN